MRSKEHYEKRMKTYGCVEEYEDIICPHCFQKEEDPTAFILDDDRDTEENVECQHCKQMFDIKVKVEKTYTTTKVVEDE